MVQQALKTAACIMLGFLAAGVVQLISAPPRSHPIQLLPPPTPRPIHAHICGAVVNPGVYALGQDAMVQDAVDAAGGSLDEAYLEAVNLAERVSDGQRIFIPLRQSVRAQEDPPTNLSLYDTLVNINTATAPELEQLPGIGPVLAEKIVAYRESHGPFASPEGIMLVTGIGEAKFEALKDLIRVH